MKFIAAIIIALSLGLSSLSLAEEPSLQPASPDTPNCEEKCLNSCKRHCKLECVYDCKCPKEKAASDKCHADCVTPCADKREAKDCLSEVCAKQCQKEGEV